MMMKKLHGKTLLWLGALVVAGCTLAAYYDTTEYRRVMVECAQEQFVYTAERLSAELRQYRDLGDPHGLSRFTDSVIADIPEITEFTIVDTSGRVLASSRPDLIGQSLGGDPAFRSLGQQDIYVRVDQDRDEWPLETWVPISPDGDNSDPRGAIRVRFSLAGVRVAYHTVIHRHLRLYLSLAALAFLAAVVFLHRVVLRPIRELREASERLAGGEFTAIPERKSMDEIGDLTRSFNRMTADLNSSRQYLEDYNRTLMDMIALESSRQELDQLISSIAYALIEIDYERCITRWNRAAAQIFGLSAEDIIGKRLEDAGLPWDYTQIALVIEAGMAEGGSCSRDAVAFTRRDGTAGFLSITFNRIASTQSGEEPHSRFVLLATDITEQKQAEQTLRDSEARSQAVINSSRDAIVAIDSKGLISVFNPAAERMFGHAKSEMIGMSLDGLIPEDYGARHKEALHRFLETGIIGNAIGHTIEVRALRADGSTFPVEMILSVCGDVPMMRVVSVIRDITERKRNEEQVHTSEARLQAILDGASDAIISIDETQNIILFNREAEAIFGYKTEEALGRPLDLLLPPGTARDHKDQVEVFQRGADCSRAMGTVNELYGRRKDGREFPIDVAISKLIVGGRTICTAIVRDMTERRRAEATHRRIFTALEQVNESIVITDTEGVIQYVNPAFENITQYSRDEVLGQTPRILKSGYHDAEFYEALWKTIKGGDVWSGRIINRKKDGTLFHEDVTISPVRDRTGNLVNFVAVKRDVTQEIEMETQLRQAQKLEAVGSLAAGIAHEINTPIQFVGDNVRFMSDSFEDLLKLLSLTGELAEALASHPELSAKVKEFVKTRDETDVDYLREEIPRAIEQTLDGVERVATIVRAMKDFSHPDQGAETVVNLNDALISTLTIARNELKYVADVVTDFDENLPMIPCYLGDLNQVFLNLLVNAAHAIGDKVGTDGTERGTITVSTRRDGDDVLITITDTGSGIPEGIRDRIFDHFFTTKDVGKGTGQGLSIARSVVVEKHGGQLTFESEVGKGTTFYIRLPIQRQEAEVPA